MPPPSPSEPLAQDDSVMRRASASVPPSEPASAPINSTELASHEGSLEAKFGSRLQPGAVGMLGGSTATPRFLKSRRPGVAQTPITVERSTVANPPASAPQMAQGHAPRSASVQLATNSRQAHSLRSTQPGLAGKLPPPPTPKKNVLQKQQVLTVLSLRTYLR